MAVLHSCAAVYVIRNDIADYTKRIKYTIADTKWEWYWWYKTNKKWQWHGHDGRYKQIDNDISDKKQLENDISDKSIYRMISHIQNK
jgi:hypothetical protein